MGKLLSWIVFIALAYAVMRLVVLFRRKSAALARQREAGAAQSRGGPSGAGPGQGMRQASAAEGGTEQMIACAHCGVYAPAREMVAARGRHYCSPAHRDADAH